MRSEDLDTDRPTRVLLKLVVHLAVLADDGADLGKITTELRRRIETQPALAADAIKVMRVLQVKQASTPNNGEPTPAG
jgi:hypothetical protein